LRQAFWWSGGVTPTSARVVTHLNASTDSVRLAVSPSVDLAAPIYIEKSNGENSPDFRLFLPFPVSAQYFGGKETEFLIFQTEKSTG
jgi:hypothetical protein